LRRNRHAARVRLRDRAQRRCLARNPTSFHLTNRSANSTPLRGKTLLIAAIEKNLTRVDRRTMRGEMVDHRKNSPSAIYSPKGNDKVIQTV